MHKTSEKDKGVINSYFNTKKTPLATHMRVRVFSSRTMDLQQGLVERFLMIQRKSNSIHTSTPIITTGLLISDREKEKNGQKYYKHIYIVL